jgi:hypothetical protein
MIRRNVLIMALLLSLGFNLFLLGAIGSRMGSVSDFRDARPLPPNLSWIIRDLDEDRQQELTSVIEPLATEIIPLRLAMIEAQTIAILGELTEAERQAATNFVRRRGPRDGFSGFGGPGSDGFRPPRPSGFRDGGRPLRGDRPPRPDDIPPPN